jgi:hypothetical protein
LHEKSDYVSEQPSIVDFYATEEEGIYEINMRLNKLRLRAVGEMYDGKHPFNQSRGQI